MPAMGYVQWRISNIQPPIKVPSNPVIEKDMDRLERFFCENKLPNITQPTKQRVCCHQVLMLNSKCFATTKTPESLSVSVRLSVPTPNIRKDRCIAATSWSLMRMNVVLPTYIQLTMEDDKAAARSMVTLM